MAENNRHAEAEPRGCGSTGRVLGGLREASPLKPANNWLLFLPFWSEWIISANMSNHFVKSALSSTERLSAGAFHDMSLAYWVPA